MIEICNLTKKFKNKTVLDNLSLTLPSKGIVTLNGKSGIGKTTLLNIIALEDQKYEGILKYYNQDILNKYDFKEKYIFYNRYEDNLVKSLTVEENLKLFLNDEQYLKALELIGKHELKYLLHTKAKKISNGECQKVCLILALSRRALITILDEPVGNIDADSIQDFYYDIVELGKEVLVIYVTHYEENIDNISDFIYTLEEGKIVCLKEQGIVKESLIEQNNNFSLKKFFKMSRLWNKNVLKLRLVFFNLVFYVILAILFFNIFLLSLSKYDFYAYEIKNATVESFYFNDNLNVDFGCVENIEVKNLENCLYETVSHEDGLPKKTLNKQIFFGNNFCDIKYMAITNDLAINGKNYQLAFDHIVITDYIADNLKCNIGDVLKFSNNELIVIGIVETDYLEQSHNPEYLIKYDFYYNIIYVSQKYIDYKSSLMAAHSFDTSTKIYGINTKIFNYNIVDVEQQSTTMFYSESPVAELDENSFYCGVDYFYSTFKELPGYENFDVDLMFSYLSESIGKEFEVTFDLGEYQFSKTMTFKGIIAYGNDVVFEEGFYNKIRSEIGLNNIDYSYITELNAKKIKTGDSSFNDFIKTINDRNDYTYVNKSSFDNYYDVFISKNDILLKLLVIEIFLFLSLAIIYYFAIYLMEFKEYKIIQTKGYKLKYYYAINYFYRIIIHLIISGVLITGFSLLMSSII